MDFTNGSDCSTARTTATDGTTVSKATVVALVSLKSMDKVVNDYQPVVANPELQSGYAAV